MGTTMTLKPVYKPGADSAKDDLLLTVDWVSTTGGASTTSTADFNYMFRPISDYLQGRELNMAQTNPSGTVAPTADYDGAVVDDAGQDLFGGNLGDRSATVTESSYTYDTAVYGSRFISGDLSIQITNAGAAKEGSITLTFE